MPTYLVKLLRAGVWDGNALTVVADSAEEAAHQFVKVGTLADLGRPGEACAQVAAQSRRRQRPVTFYNVDFDTVRESHSFASGQRVQFTWGPHERKTAEVIQTRYKDGSAYVDVRLDDGGRINKLRAETFALAPPSGSVMDVSARGVAGDLAGREMPPGQGVGTDGLDPAIAARHAQRRSAVARMASGATGPVLPLAGQPPPTPVLATEDGRVLTTEDSDPTALGVSNADHTIADGSTIVPSTNIPAPPRDAQVVKFGPPMEPTGPAETPPPQADGAQSQSVSATGRIGRLSGSATLTPRPPNWNTDKPFLLRLLDEVRIWMRDMRPVVEAANELRKQERGAGDNSGEPFLDLTYFDKAILAADLAREELAADRITSNSAKLSILDLQEAQTRIAGFVKWATVTVGTTLIGLAITKGYDAATGADALQRKLLGIAGNLERLVHRMLDIYQVINVPLTFS